jgi:hypothetical protein
MGEVRAGVILENLSDAWSNAAPRRVEIDALVDTGAVMTLLRRTS